MGYLKHESRLAFFVKKIKKMEIKNFRDIKNLSYVASQIFEEWKQLKDRFRRKLNNRKEDLFFLAEHEAEEELLIGLIFLINEKLIKAVRKS